MEEQDRRAGPTVANAERRFADVDSLELEVVEHRPAILSSAGQLLMRIATSYLDTDDRCPGVSPAGIALRISSAFA